MSEDSDYHHRIRVRGPDSRPDPTLSEDSDYHHRIRVRGPDSRPDQTVSEDTVHHTYEAKDSTPGQTISSITARNARAPSIRDLTDDQDAWDTIIVCSLLGKLFRRSMSSVDIAKAITVRDKHTGIRTGPESVEHMLEFAKLPSTQQRYPETCQYQKWEAVKDRLVASKGVMDDKDKDVWRAYLLYKDTLRLLKWAELGRRSDNPVRHDSKQHDYKTTGQQSGSQHSPGEGYKP